MKPVQIEGLGRAPGVVGSKLAFLNQTDRILADDIQPTYTIEVAFARSPEKKVKAGAIVVWKATELDLPSPDKVDPHELAEARRAVEKQTEEVYMDPIYFTEKEGRWIPWALDKVLDLYDKFGGNARVILKAPTLKIRQEVSSRTIAAKRSNLQDLFHVAWDIDKLLNQNFNYDPWSKAIRRGLINAAMSKR